MALLSCGLSFVFRTLWLFGSRRRGIKWELTTLQREIFLGFSVHEIKISISIFYFTFLRAIILLYSNLGVACQLPLIEYDCVLGNPKHFHFSNFVWIKKYGKLWKALMAIPPLKHFLFSNSTYFLSFLSFTLFGISCLNLKFLFLWQFGQGKKTNWRTEFKAHFNISN